MDRLLFDTSERIASSLTLSFLVLIFGSEDPLEVEYLLFGSGQQTLPINDLFIRLKPLYEVVMCAVIINFEVLLLE